MSKKCTNLGFNLLFCIYIVLFLADLTTTYMNNDILGMVEINILYGWAGSLIPVILLNLFIIWLLYYCYTHKKTHPATRYAVIAIMLVISLIRITAIHNALEWHDQPPEIKLARAQNVQPAEIKAAQKQHLLSIYSPIILLILVYGLWRLDHNVTRKDCVH